MSSTPGELQGLERGDALIDAATGLTLFLPTDLAREIAAWALSLEHRVDAGVKHSVALRSDGSLVIWGRLPSRGGAHVHQGNVHIQ